MTRTQGWTLGLALVLVGCANERPDQDGAETEIEETELALNPLTLEDYFESHNDREIEPDLIACAAGGHEDFMVEGVAPISVFFLPYEGAHDFRYWETPSVESDPRDWTAYTEVDHEMLPVFNGFLRRFDTGYTDRDTWVMITYLTPGKVRRAEPVRLKITDKPTEFNPDIVEVSIEDGKPVFTWEDGRTKENEIYFEVVSDMDDNLISGVYTYDKRWTFYDLSNVEINVKEQTPPPTLTSGEPYNFTLMAVSDDNWVNLIARKQFVAP